MQIYSETLILQIQFTFRCFQVWGHKPQLYILCGSQAALYLHSCLQWWPTMRSIFARDVWLACTESPSTQKNYWWIANTPTKENHPSMHVLPHEGRVAPIAAPLNSTLPGSLVEQILVVQDVPEAQVTADRLQQLNVFRGHVCHSCSCIKLSSLQALVTLVPASRWIVYGVHGLSGGHAPNVVTRSDLSRAAIIEICGRRLDESSFTCFRYFWNLCFFVFCLMKLFSILALVRRIATTLLANLANPSYRVQPSRHWQKTCSTSFTSSPLCYFYVDMQIVNMVHIHYNTCL